VKQVFDEWGTLAVLMACMGSNFKTNLKYTPPHAYKRLEKEMEACRPLLTLVADCVQPRWREVIPYCPDIHIEVAPNPGQHLHQYAIAQDGNPIRLPHTNIGETKIDRIAWPNKDPRRIECETDFTCVDCNGYQAESSSQKIRGKRRCNCASRIFSNHSAPDRVIIYETNNMGFGVRALDVS
jgi:hypothetical protein